MAQRKRVKKPQRREMARPAPSEPLEARNGSPRTLPTIAPAVAAPRWARQFLAAAVLIAVAIAAYSNSFKAPLVMDGVAILREALERDEAWPWQGVRPLGFITFKLNTLFNVW